MARLSSAHLHLTSDAEESLRRQAASLNARLHRRGRTGFTLVPCPALPDIAKPYQVWVGPRRLTPPLEGSQVRTYLEGADKALELREEARGRTSPRPVPRLPRAAAGDATAGASAGELAAVLHAAEVLNARLNRPPERALSIVATEPVEYIRGGQQPYALEIDSRRRTIPLTVADLYLYLDGMAAALDLVDDTAARRRAPAVSAGVAGAAGAAPVVLPRRAKGRPPVPPTAAAALLPGSTAAVATTRRRPHPAAAVPAATRRAYEGDLDYFWSWAAAELGLAEVYPAPAAAVLQFVTDHLRGLPAATDRALVDAGVKAAPGPHRPATVARRVSSLSAAHQALGAANPCTEPALRKLLVRARRRPRPVPGVTAPARLAALGYEALTALLASCGEDLIGRRDRALLLLAWTSGGLRRGQLAAARVEDLTPIEGGYLFRPPLRPAASVPAIPVLGQAAAALSAWLAAAGIAAGPLFRPINRHGRLGASPLSSNGVTVLLNRRAEMAGSELR
jgi:integrase